MRGLVASTSRPARRRQQLLLSVSAGALAFAAAPAARAAGPAPFSAAWFAAKGAAGPAATAAIANAAAGAGMTSTSYAQVRQSLANLQHAAAAVAAMRTLQSQAHAAAGLVGIPDGLQRGGIVPDTGLAAAGVANPVTTWTGAAAPVQTGPAAAPTVTVRQTAQNAFLNWTTLDVGAHTTLHFDQSAGGAAAPTWVALNRVDDPGGAATLIAGRITAEGHVVIIDNSGILFTPTAQVTVGSLIASTASITSAQFDAGGIYGANGTTPSFTGATAPVTVQQGAQIGTTAPITVTSAGGGVILLGSDVINAGAISTPEGQTVLAAGRDFALQQGYSVTQLAAGAAQTNFGLAATVGGNTYRTTRGTEIAVTAGGGSATNSGLIEADQGDITVVGETVTQAGVAASTTTTATRGTIHLLTDQRDAKSSVTLAPGSVTTILPDAAGGTALDAQRATAVADSADADLIRAEGTGLTFLNDQPGNVPDNQYQSLIQIVSGDTVDAGAGSLALSQGGQIQIVAPGRVLVETGAQLDVSGAVGVTLPMSANQVSVNVQGFELRDDPLNRDTTLLNNSTVYLDSQNLVTVASSPADVDSPYDTSTAPPRLYTKGGLLEVSGEVSNIAHTIGEWSAPGGTILISGGAAGQVVAQPGSVFNLAGGSIDYAAGTLKLTWLVGPNGVLYNAQTAPADLVYTGIYDGVSESHARWNVTDTYDNPLIAPATENLPGYVVGRDGGTLEISEPTALLEGTVDAGVVDGPNQNAARSASVTDPYLQPQTALPLAGQLLIGNYGGLAYGSSGLTGGYDTTVTLQSGGAPAAAALALATPLPAGRLDTASLDTAALDADGLGALSVTTEGTATVASPLTLADAGQLTIHAAAVVVDAGLTAHAGTVALGDVIPVLEARAGAEPEQSLVPTLLTATGSSIPAANAAVVVASGVAIDLTGRWTNTALDPTGLAGEAAVNGGSLTIDTTGAVTLSSGSTVDASAGAILSAAGRLGSGAGGSVTLIGDDPNGNPVYEQTGLAPTLPVALAGTIRSIGAAGTAGGTLTLRAPAVLVEDTATPTALTGDGRTVLTPSFFDAGFTAYSIDGYGNLAAAPSTAVVTPFAAPAAPAAPLPGIEFTAGTAIHPLVPVYLQTTASLLAPTGSDPATAAAAYLPPLYVQDQVTATLTARAGASLELYSRNFNQLAGTTSLLLDGGGAVAVGPGASITVDPSQTVRVEALGQITALGDITAPGGTITLQNDRYEPGTASAALEYSPDLSIWIGSDAVLDASGVAAVATDLLGRPYGLAPSGGLIAIGGPRTTAGGYAESTDATVVIRPGALLEASGSTATIDLAAGQGPNTRSTETSLAGAGGAIELDSTSAVALDGTLRAAAGAPNAAGGALEVDLVTPTYSTQGTNQTLIYTVPDALRVQRVITVSQQAMPSPLPAAQTPGASLAAIFGSANVDADAVAAGGFGTLTLAGGTFAGAGPAAVRFAGPVSLATSDSIDLPAQLTETDTDTAVMLAAPFVTLNGNAEINAFLSTASGFQQQTATFQAAEQRGYAAASATASASTLSIDAGQLLIETGTIAGLQVTTALTSTATPTAVSDQPGFGSAAFLSRGDTQLDGTFEAAGRLSLTAAQIYPLATSTVALDFDQNGSARNSAQPGTLVIARTAGTDPAAPLVVGQGLTLAAAVIEQGGIVRSPLGAITLGFSSATPGAPEASVDYADRVEFEPGSVTSVSADGQTILYGGTADGVTYTAGAAALTTGDGLPAPSITVAAQSVSLDAGATLDLSGGGTLAGAAFNSGRGGSTDVLTAPLLQFGGNAATQPATDAVYAIVPGTGTTQPAPVTAIDYSGSVDAAPPTGEQLTIASGVAGLAAGTYTLQPAYDALLPGAVRVELQPAVTPVTTLAAGIGDLSTETAGTVGIAGTSIRGSTPIGVIVTTGAAIRRLSSYDEESAPAFVLAEAALLGTPRGTLPADAGTVLLSYNAPAATHTLAGPSLSVGGTALFQPAAGGDGGFVDVTGTGPALDIVADGDAAAGTVAASVKTATATTTVVSLRASDLDRLAPDTLSIGGTETLPSAQSTVADFGLYLFNGSSPSVTVERGAVLSAPQVFLIGQNVVSVAAGASIDTLGRAAPSTDSADGFLYTDFNGATSVPVLAVSNGILNFAAPQLTGASSGSITIAGGAALVGAGTVAIDTPGTVAIGDGAVFAARDLSFAVSAVNVLPAAGLPAGAAAPAGLALSQPLLSSLTAGGIVPGAPALQQIELTATSSVNFFGTVGFDLGGAQTLILDTPSIYGVGAPSDRATVTAGTFIWNGIAAVASTSGTVGIAGSNTGLTTYMSEPAAPVMTDGPGTGAGGLVVDATDIVLGYAPGQQVLAPAAAGGTPALDRNTYGFASVALNAAGSVTANSAGTLAVYQAQGAYANGGYANTGGALTIDTPLLTTTAGALLQASAGGAVTLASAGGTPAGAAGLGGEIDLAGSTITIGDTVRLPEGKLALTAAGDIALAAGAAIDLAGVPNVFFDQTVAGPGGTLVAETTTGSLTTDPASTIDVSSPGGTAGSIELTAGAGAVSLAGAISGGGSGQGGSIGIRAGTLADFAGLNQRLTAGGLDGGRTAEIAQGDLTVETADAVRAGNVDITLDSGSLTVDGLIDASGPAPGRISLSAGDNLVLTARAVLDAHGNAAQTDSLGNSIDSENTGAVTLRVADGPAGTNLAAAGANGTLTIASGATIDVGAAPGVACAAGPCGQVTFDVPRLGSATGTAGDLALSAAGTVNIAGAGSVAVDGFWTYAPPDGLVTQTNTIAGASVDPNGIGLDQIDAANRLFIAGADPDGALNATLAAKLAGLTIYASAFHLRPGVEIDSSTASDGNLTVNGDLDLSALRYASLNASSRLTPAYGSGEPGVLVLRAGNALAVYGSVTDGFEQPVDSAASPNPDDNGWILQDTNLTGSNTDQPIVVPPGADPIDIGGSVFNGAGPATSVNYAVAVAGGQSLASGTVLPTAVSLQAPLTVAAPVVAQGAVIGIDGRSVLYAKGSTIPAGTVLPAAATLDAGFVLFAGTPIAATNTVTGAAQAWPAGASFAPFGVNGATLAASVVLQAGDIIPADTRLTLNTAEFSDQVNLRQPTTLPNGLTGQGEIYAATNILPAGSLSWSVALVAGANTASADPTALTPATVLAASGNTGDLTLADLHSSIILAGGSPTYAPAFSVVRTGTGSLSLLAGGTLDETSSYGIYTAGAQSPGTAGTAFDGHSTAYATADPSVSSAAEAAVYDSIDAAYPQGGGNVAVQAQGDLLTTSLPQIGIAFGYTSQTGAWLERQGDGSAANPGAWWVNFGNYEPVTTVAATNQPTTDTLPLLVGFTGIGTLGGGNLTVVVGGDAGVASLQANEPQSAFIADTNNDTLSDLHDSSLDLAVASTGRQTASGLLVTGGGTLGLQVGGVLDPIGNNLGAETAPISAQSTIVSLRGAVSIAAGSVSAVNGQTGRATPLDNPYTASVENGPELILGDASASITTRGDISLGEVGDAAREPTLYASPDGATSWFSLWQPTTAVRLYSAGGNISPAILSESATYDPPTLDAVAASGSIYTLTTSAAADDDVLETAPSATGEIQFLAGTSIVDGLGRVGSLTETTIVAMSGASPALIPTVANPAFTGETGAVPDNTAAAAGALFAFGTDTPTSTLHAGDPNPIRFYAATGDIENLSTGEILTGTATPQYLAAKPVRIEAGRDIVDLDPAANSGLLWNNTADDVSEISAGRDIFYANADVSGPGLLEVSAGGNIDQTETDGTSFSLTSLGYLVDKTVATQNSGAGITVSAGATPATLDLAAFAALYFNPANLADPLTPLQDQPGRVERTYQSELLTFLQQRTGYTGSAAGALAAFAALPPDIQQILVLQTYYAELNQSGLDDSNPASRFYQSYSEGAEAVSTLLPATGQSGQSGQTAAGGSLTLTGGSGITTEFGGSVEILDPAGATTVGVPGAVPPSTAGVITQGSGDVDIYSYGSVLLGQSRIFTTFGGNILIWLQGNGEINGGQGASSTIVFTPPVISYDPVGDVSLSPTAPSTGAGIATLAPVAGVPPGDINLISPFGTIDAGEAGIRSSGNVNLVALTILNAANVQAGGHVTGVPVAAAPNVAAITAASAAAGSTANAAQNNLRPVDAEKTPSIITVDVVGSGGGNDPASSSAASSSAAGAAAAGGGDERRKHKR